MRFEFKPSFDRSVKALRSKEKEEAKSIAIQTIDILSQLKIQFECTNKVGTRFILELPVVK